MMDRTIKRAFVIQKRDLGKEITENSQNLTEKSWGLMQLSADPKLMYEIVKADKVFDSRP